MILASKYRLNNQVTIFSISSNFPWKRFTKEKGLFKRMATCPYKKLVFNLICESKEHKSQFHHLKRLQTSTTRKKATNRVIT